MKKKIKPTRFVKLRGCEVILIGIAILIALFIINFEYCLRFGIGIYDLSVFQSNLEDGCVGKTLHYLEWSEDGKLLTEESFTIELTPEQQSEVWEYLNLMTEGGHLTFRKQNLRNQMRIQLTNPSSPYFYRDQYSPDTRFFLRSGNYEEGFAKLLAMVDEAKDDLENEAVGVKSEIVNS